jgi:hypothetical protein
LLVDSGYPVTQRDWPRGTIKKAVFIIEILSSYCFIVNRMLLVKVLQPYCKIHFETFLDQSPFDPGPLKRRRTHIVARH